MRKKDDTNFTEMQSFFVGCAVLIVLVALLAIAIMVVG